jgi:hypothetical protein
MAGREFSSGYFHPALHPCWMFDKIDVDGGSREQATREHSKEFSDLAHCSQAPAPMTTAFEGMRHPDPKDTLNRASPAC